MWIYFYFDSLRVLGITIMSPRGDWFALKAYSRKTLNFSLSPYIPPKHPCGLAAQMHIICALLIWNVTATWGPRCVFEGDSKKKPKTKKVPGRIGRKGARARLQRSFSSFFLFVWSWRFPVFFPLQNKKNVLNFGNVIFCWFGPGRDSGRGYLFGIRRSISTEKNIWNYTHFDLLKE